MRRIVMFNRVTADGSFASAVPALRECQLVVSPVPLGGGRPLVTGLEAPTKLALTTP